MKQRPKQRWPDKDTYYTKINAKDSDNDDSGDETELFNVCPKFKEVSTIDKSIEEGDTLQSIAIRYHCTVAELKRINNIHRDNEIFAKIIIKVPIRPFTMAGVHGSGSSSPLSSLLPTVDADTLKNKLATVSTSNESKTDSVNDLIFNSTLNSPVVTKVPSTEVIDTQASIDEEEVHLLPCEVVTPTTSVLSCSGVDGDLSWLTLITCVLILSFAGPLIYVFYIAEHPEKYLHHNHDHNS